MRVILKGRLPAAILVVLLSATLFASLVEVPEEVSAYTPHSTIHITGNAEFTPANGVTGGSGTPSDPYIIEGWEIEASTFTGILIVGTTAHFVIRDSSIANGSFSIPGICLNGVSNGVVENVVVFNNEKGIYLLRSSNVTVASNSVWYNYYGIYLDRSVNNTVENNTVQGRLPDMPSGIFLEESNNNTITNNIAFDNWEGIYLDRSKGNTIANNTLLDNQRGIYLSQSNSNTISDNEVSSNNGEFGIYLGESNKNTIANNIVLGSNLGIVFMYATNHTLTNNSMVATGIAIYGWVLEQWNTHTIDTTNNVNGRPVYYWKDRTEGTIPLGAGEVILVNCTGVRVENQNVSNGSIGMLVGFSSQNTIANTTASTNNQVGISVRHSNNITFIDSTITSNREGMRLTFSSNTEIAGLTISQNRYSGLTIEYSHGTVVRDSHIIGNGNDGVEAFDTSDTQILNTNISMSGHEGILAGKSPNLWVENCTISGNELGIHFWYYTPNATVVNSTVSDNSNVDFKVGPRSNATALNTTFNKTKVMFWEDLISNLTVKWFAHVKVIDINNKPVTGADVEVRDLNDDPVFSGATSPDGYARWIVSTEYYQNDTNGDNDGEDPGEKVFYTPHNITVSRDGCVAYADPEPFMDQSREIIVKLQCAYTTYTVTKSPVQGNVTIDGVDCPAPAILGLQQGSTHTISVNSPENQGPDSRFIFDYWDDGGAQTHDIIVGIADTVITAFYRTQYRPTITLIGLDPTHTVTVYHTRDGLPDNDPGIFDLWSDWCDNGTSLSMDVDGAGSTATERWHTYSDFAISPWTSVVSPFAETVTYYHQYKPTITLAGTDATHNVTAYHTEGGTAHDDLGTFNSWSDWSDEGTSLSFDSDTSGSTSIERWHTYTDFGISPWSGVTSAFTETVTYHHQYNVNITVNGLISSHPATITVIQGGITFNPTTFTTWSDWADGSTTLSIVDTVAVSPREQYHTTDTVSWTVNSALSLTVNYTHQFMPAVTLIGTDSIHTVNVVHTLDGLPHDDTNVFSSWSDWADNGSALTFDDCTTGTPTRCTTDIRNFTIDSAFNATITYTEPLPPVNYTITKSPLQGYVIVDGVQYTAPVVFNWAPGEVHNISVNSPEFQGTDTRYIFDYWDDGGAQTHDITVGITDTVITAFYRTQYRPSVTLIGLDIMHTVTVHHTKDGLPENDAGVFDTWSDWCDNGTSLSLDVDAVGSSVTERWHTYVNFTAAPWVSVTSPFVETVAYYHQYKPSIALVGTDTTHSVTAHHFEGGGSSNDPGIFNSWSDWCDEGTSLSFDADTSGSTTTERWHTYADFGVPPWNGVASAFTETVTYYHQFKVTVATNGLIPSYPAAITIVQGSTPSNPTTHTSWSDWTDADSGLSITDVIAVSGTERYSTIDATSWIVNSASTWTVDYHHQYKSTITAIGLVSVHPATITFVQYGSTSNPTTHATWSDWTDDSSTLTIVDTVVVSGTERYSTIDTTLWIMSSSMASTVEYYHQFKVDLTVNGLISSYPATVAVIQRGSSFNPTTYATWSDWADADSTMSVNETLMVSARERYHTGEANLWTVDSALSLTVNYTHQFMPAVTLLGTDSIHTVSVAHTLDGQLHDDSGVFTNWSEWADNGYQLTFSEYASGEPRRHTEDIRAWSVDSPFDATITYAEAPDGGEGEEQNFKPTIALIFCVILAITGVMIAYRRPLRLTKQDQVARNRLYTGILIVLPFVVAEALTGLISLYTGALSVPPVLGLGTVVDSCILAVGLIAQFWSFRKANTYERD